MEFRLVGVQWVHVDADGTWVVEADGLAAGADVGDAETESGDRDRRYRLQTLLRQRGPLTEATICEITGWPQPSVNRVLRGGAGIWFERISSDPVGRGRPPYYWRELLGSIDTERGL